MQAVDRISRIDDIDFDENVAVQAIGLAAHFYLFAGEYALGHFYRYIHIFSVYIQKQVLLCAVKCILQA